MPAGATNLPSARTQMIPIRISTTALRWIFVWTILLSSLTTLLAAAGLMGDPPNSPIMLLASVEIAAIAAFATERWRTLAAVILVMVFAVAFFGSAFEGEFAARFIYFAASTIYLQGVDRRIVVGQTLG